MAHMGFGGDWGIGTKIILENRMGKKRGTKTEQWIYMLLEGNEGMEKNMQITALELI